VESTLAQHGDGTFTDFGAETGFDGDEDRSGVYPPGVDRETEPPFRANGNTFDCAVADYDGDGDLDCFLARSRTGGRIVLRPLDASREPRPAQGYRFRRRPELVERRHARRELEPGRPPRRLARRRERRAARPLIASSDYPDEQILRLYHQRADGTFEDWTDRLGCRWVNASQISLGDFDRDGATDILVGRNHMRLPVEQRARLGLAVGLFRNRAAAARVTAS